MNRENILSPCLFFLVSTQNDQPSRPLALNEILLYPRAVVTFGTNAFSLAAVILYRIPQTEDCGAPKWVFPQARPADPRGREAAGTAAEGEVPAAGQAAGPRAGGAAEGLVRLPGVCRVHSVFLQKGEATFGEC